MSRITFLLLGLLVLSLFSSCGSSSTHRRLDGPREEIAELIGSPTEFKLLGETRLILFTSLDGVEFEKGWADSFPDVIDVLPGKHKVGIYYSINYDSQLGPYGDLVAEIDAKAGKAYKVELLLHEVTGWYAEFRETAPTSQMSGPAEPSFD